MFSADRDLPDAVVEAEEESTPEPIPRDTWEDDIDYCYDHEAEAHCDFAWERPSLDLDQDTRDEGLTAVYDDTEDDEGDAALQVSVPGQFDMPALSPASQVSTATAHSAVTPTVAAMAKPLSPSNFSLPKNDLSLSQRYLRARAASDVASHAEVRRFNLSPAAAAPEYRQNFFAGDSDDLLITDHQDFAPYRAAHYDDTAAGATSRHVSRTSASTTGSFDTYRTTMISDRHFSTTSAATDLTRLTMSTSSLDMESYMANGSRQGDEAETAAVRLSSGGISAHTRAKSQATMPILPEREELAPEQQLPSPVGLYQYHRRQQSSLSGGGTFMLRRGHTYGSDSNLARLAAEGAGGDDATGGGRYRASVVSLHARRRARSSLSTPPPEGQYALFPAVQITGSQI
jgi:hypothetical protein